MDFTHEYCIFTIIKDNVYYECGAFSKNNNGLCEVHNAESVDMLKVIQVNSEYFIWKLKDFNNEMKHRKSQVETIDEARQFENVYYSKLFDFFVAHKFYVIAHADLNKYVSDKLKMLSTRQEFDVSKYKKIFFSM